MILLSAGTLGNLQISTTNDSTSPHLIKRDSPGWIGSFDLGDVACKHPQLLNPPTAVHDHNQMLTPTTQCVSFGPLNPTDSSGMIGEQSNLVSMDYCLPYAAIQVFSGVTEVSRAFCSMHTTSSIVRKTRKSQR